MCVYVCACVRVRWWILSCAAHAHAGDLPCSYRESEGQREEEENRATGDFDDDDDGGDDDDGDWDDAYAIQI